jgi:crotonobetainyl-CoA:carnitine CoA-transferase CaiB-like acyl-CoA transferase
MALELEILEKDLRFENTLKREENCRELIAIFDRLFAAKSRNEWLRILSASKELHYAPINYIVDVLKDSQVIANEYSQEFDHPSLGRIQMPAYNTKFSEMSCGMRLSAPLMGEQRRIFCRRLAVTAKMKSQS